MEYDLFRFLTALFYPHKPGFRKVIENYIDFSGNEELKKEAAAYVEQYGSKKE